MSVQPSGLAYLWTYSGGLNILEELLNVSVISFLYLSGYCTKGYILNFLSVAALVGTAVFVVLHVYGVTKKSKWPWHWIECVYVLTMAIVLAISASVVISVLTRGYIITGVTGYILATLYFLDTFDKYQIAVAPQAKYAWTTPNMPDLE